ALAQEQVAHCWALIDLIQCVPLALPPYYNDERDLRPVKPVISSCLPLSIFDQLCPKTERSVRESSAPPTKIERCHHTSSFPPFAVYSTRVERYTQPEWSGILNQSGALYSTRVERCFVNAMEC